MKAIRLIPVLVGALTVLVLLKSIGILADGGYVLSGPGVAIAQEVAGESEASDDAAAFTEEADEQADGSEEAGMAPETQTAESADGNTAEVARPTTFSQGSRSEAALLNRLRERRKSLDERERELGLREAMLAATEKRVEERIAELKAAEQSLGSELKKKEQQDQEVLNKLIKMYEQMKPKAAARIFDRLEIPVAIDLIGKINPRKMSDILGEMSPERAEMLTVAIARNSRDAKPDKPRTLPKIQSRP